MAQRWHDLLFAHWPVPPERLEPAIPPGLALDTYDGHAWLGVIPFHMTGIRLRGLPPLLGLSAFPELNVRTYATAATKPGVLFFSLDAGSRLAVEVARRWYHLPYFHAVMAVTPEGEGVGYRSRRQDRRGAPAELRGRYRSAADAVRGRSRVGADREAGRRLSGQPEHAEQPPDGVGLGHRAQDSARAGTARAHEDVDREHPA
jgi:hypothetical protein